MMNKDEKNSKIRNIVKKGLTLSLCAVLAGGLAAGTFEGVNQAMNWNQGIEVQASTDEAQLTLTKTSKKSEKDTKKEEPTVKGSLDVSDIAEAAMPSVVSITTKSIQEVQNYFDMFGGFGGYSYMPAEPEQREVEGRGSGIIIGKNDSELLVATNYHVVQGANTLSVSFVDNEVYEAKVKGFDEEKDLAVVSVALDDINGDTMDAIKIATIGSSDDLKVGNQVVAIGNALGYGQSVTTGIVSAKNRRMDEDANTVSDGEEGNGVNLIQTDAAINPGNSGGALLNMDGEVVGINSAKLASTEVEGMGYAIAISDVSDIIENLMNEKSRDKLEDSAHGVLQITGQSVSEEAQRYGIPAGAFIEEVIEGGAGEEAGLKHGNIITEFNGKSVSSIEQLIEYLYYYEPGEEVELTIAVQSGDGYKEKTVTVVLGKNTEETTEDGEDKEEKKSEKDDERTTLNRGKKDGGDGFEDEDQPEEEDPEAWGEDYDDEEDSDSNPFLDFFKRG